MPRHTNITIVAGVPAALSDGAVDACRVQNLSGYGFTLQATASGTPPGLYAGGVTLGAGETLAADLRLADLFPGVGSGALYLWGMSENPVTASVSHA
ncbi:hypothetical protein [Nostoc phage Nsp-JY21]